MSEAAVFNEVRPSIPAIDLSRLEGSMGKSHEELLGLVPEINVMEMRRATGARAEGPIDVLCWNGERGRFVLEETPLPTADIYLLNEMDAGMARTENVHTVRTLSERIGLNYLFGVEFLELTKGEPEERNAAGENELGFHGNAILTRYEMKAPRLLRFDGGSQWLEDDQRRIGSRMALICQIETERGPLRVVCTHLESESPPSLRTRQMKQLLDHLETNDDRIPTILAGDLNTWSFDKRDRDAQAKLARAPETPARLLSPMPWEPLFEELTACGFEYEASNDLTRGTYPVPDFPVEARLDWIFTRGVEAGEPTVIPAPHSERRGRPISDHHAIGARLR